MVWEMKSVERLLGTPVSLADPISGTAVLENGATEILPLGRREGESRSDLGRSGRVSHG